MNDDPAVVTGNSIRPLEDQVVQGMFAFGEIPSGNISPEVFVGLDNCRELVDVVVIDKERRRTKDEGDRKKRQDGDEYFFSVKLNFFKHDFP